MEVDVDAAKLAAPRLPQFTVPNINTCLRCTDGSLDHDELKFDLIHLSAADHMISPSDVIVAQLNDIVAIKDAELAARADEVRLYLFFLWNSVCLSLTDGSGTKREQGTGCVADPFSNFADTPLD